MIKRNKKKDEVIIGIINSISHLRVVINTIKKKVKSSLGMKEKRAVFSS